MRTVLRNRKLTYGDKKFLENMKIEDRPPEFKEIDVNGHKVVIDLNNMPF